MRRVLRFSLLMAVLLAFGMSAWSQSPSKCILWNDLGSGDSLIFERINVNSSANDYAPVVGAGMHLYFTSDRKNNHVNESVFEDNEDIYVAAISGKTWNGGSHGYFFNSDDHTAIAGASLNGDRLYLYKTFGNGDIYVSKNNKGQWQQAVAMNRSVNSQGHEQSIALAGNLMVIASEREGGLGGHDIYYTVYNDNDANLNWMPLSVANTAGEEVDVRLSADGKRIWFASDGRSDSKGFDIFVCELDTLGNWQMPQRLKDPINTEYNDRWFFDTGDRFLLSSDRPGGNGGDDIYLGYLQPKDSSISQYFELPYSMRTDTLITIHITKDGRVTDSVPSVSDRYAELSQYMDSLGITDFYAMVQVGAYFGLSMEKFRAAYPSLKSMEITTETAVKPNGGKITRFLINTKFNTLKEAAQLQEVMINTHHIRDAFVAVYNRGGERIAIYNTFTGSFVLLKEGAVPRIF